MTEASGYEELLAGYRDAYGDEREDPEGGFKPTSDLTEEQLEEFFAAKHDHEHAERLLLAESADPDDWKKLDGELQKDGRVSVELDPDEIAQILDRGTNFDAARAIDQAKYFAKAMREGSLVLDQPDSFLLALDGLQGYSAPPPDHPLYEERARRLGAMVELIDRALEIPLRRAAPPYKEFTTANGDVVVEEFGRRVATYGPDQVVSIEQAAAAAAEDDYGPVDRSGNVVLSPEQASNWSAERWLRFTDENPREADLLLQGETIEGFRPKPAQP